MKATTRAKIAVDDRDLGGDHATADIPLVSVSEAIIAAEAEDALKTLKKYAADDLALALGIFPNPLLKSDPMKWRCEKCGRDDFKGHKGLSIHDRTCRADILAVS